MNDLEAPWVGGPEEKEEETYYCPCCGEECEQFYYSDGKIIGCENCVKSIDAWEWESDYEDDY